jgi:molybdopterin synthase catalytic subunit
MIEIVPHIDPVLAYSLLQAPDTGGMALFVGTVRNHAHGKEVVRLMFEAYEPMALSEMKKIAARAREHWPLSGVVMQHVIGERKVGEAVVLVGASSAHRSAAFEACRFLIDELKATVPIWKKEFYADSSIWIAAHP